MKEQLPEGMTKKQLGHALSLIVQYEGIPVKVLSHHISVPVGTIYQAFNGHPDSSVTRYNSIALGLKDKTKRQSIKKFTDAFEAGENIDLVKVIECADYIETVLLHHWQHFPEILEAYEKENHLTHAQIGAKISHPNSSDKERSQYVRKTIARKIDTSPFKVTNWLGKLGFESMQEFINAAGVSKKFPLPKPAEQNKTASEGFHATRYFAEYNKGKKEGRKL